MDGMDGMDDIESGRAPGRIGRIGLIRLIGRIILRSGWKMSRNSWLEWQGSVRAMKNVRGLEKIACYYDVT